MTEHKVNTSAVKQAIQKNQAPQTHNQGAESRSPVNSIADYLKKMGPAMKNVLPNHMTPERMARIALSEIRKNPTLLQCDVASLGAAVMQAAVLGLEPSVLGHCYFVPFWNRNEKRRDVQFIIGYRGYIDLARRSGDVLSINAMEVRENDQFEFEYGLEEKLRHIPALKNRGAVTHYYAYAKFKGGGHTFLVMSKDDILEHAFTHSKQIKNNQLTGTWKDHFESMAKKTVIRAMIKYMPLSIEIQEKMNADDRIIHGVTKDGEIESDELFTFEGEASEVEDTATLDVPQEELQDMEKDLQALRKKEAAEDEALQEARKAQETLNSKKQEQK